MGLPKQFNDIIENQLNVFAAWLPVTNTYQLGDYGIIADGVFAKMGNIKEFGVDFLPGKGQESKIDFTSDSTTVTNFAAGVQVDVIPEGAVNAKVSFKFEKARSFLIKSPAINVDTIENVNEVGNKLMDHPKWDRKFKVVFQTYFAKEVAIISTIDAGTEIIFDGDVKALQKVNVGNINVGFSSNRKLGLELQGKEGVIGLGLFQIVKKNFLSKEKVVKILGDSDEHEIAELKDADDDV